MTHATRSTNLTRRAACRRGLALVALGCGSAAAEEISDASVLLDPVAHDSADPALVSFDRMMTSFMSLNEAPGAALAVTKDSRLVYARGFGWANLENNQTAAADSLFRIASVSKPITGAAIVQLVERGKLSLDDRLLELVSYEPFFEEGAEFDPRLKDVTVRHLLHHTAGWDRAKSFDPMVSRSAEIAGRFGAESPATIEQIIRYMLGRGLDTPPGERYAYSNFGYCLLGRVIEKVSGVTYEKYVQDELLAPLGVTQMQLGRTLPADRAAKEVTYYDDRRQKRPAVTGPNLGKPVSAPDGGWCLEVMDAHGGWIASAIDLVRFAAAFDRPDHCPLMSAESVETMFTPPADSQGKKASYACGWSVHGKNQFHSGALDGTASLLVRRGDGLNWAVLFNSCNTPQGKNLAHELDYYLHLAADKVKQWPAEDLFSKYLAVK